MYRQAPCTSWQASGQSAKGLQETKATAVIEFENFPNIKAKNFFKETGIRYNKLKLKLKITRPVEVSLVDTVVHVCTHTILALIGRESMAN